MPEITETAPVTPTVSVVETPVVETTTTAPVTETTETAKKDDFIPKSRFNEVYADRMEQKRRADRLEALLEKQLTGKTEAPTAQTDAPPDPAKYEGREAQYYADLAAHTARQEWARMSQQQAQNAQAEKLKTDQTTASQNYLAKVSAEVAKDPALQADLAMLDTVQWPAQTALLLEGHENAGLLAKHLARNLQEAHQLAALAQTNPIAAAMKIGELGARLQGSVQPSKTPQTTKAPEPLEIVKGGGKTTPGYTPGESSVSDYIRTYYPPPG